jgi:glycosyltransferase involved in cell wall biosynthesis
MAESFSIVLPVHNQGDHIESILNRHAASLNRLGISYELIAVANACTDDSLVAIARAAAAGVTVRSIDLREGGWGRAVRTGLAEAGGTIVGYTNSARTTAEMLTLMVSYARGYPDVVLKANRRIRDSLHRRLGSLIYNLECRALFDLATWDVNGTPKLFPRRFERLLQLERDDDLIDLEFVATCAMAEYPIVEIPLLETVRHGGRSTTGLRTATRLYRGAFELRHRPDLRRDRGR